MKYGLIGEHLSHSFSKLVHERIADYKYELCEIEPAELEGFIKKREFSAINVTIPYKQTVIPMLDFVDEMAKNIGAVNTVVNRNGKLYGYNTDFYGLKGIIERLGIPLENKKVLICGTGGTSKTARAVAESLGAREVIRLSRREGGDAVTYSEAYEKHADADVLINTTPVGMYPNTDSSPIELSKFTKLSCVIDAVYNPIRTTLVSEAQKRGIVAEGGLYMLVGQAVKACEIFLGQELSHDTADKIYSELFSEKENIVLVGMPASGKTTVGKLVAEQLGREFFDADDELVSSSGREIVDIFATDGEARFRDIEADVIASLSQRTGAVIATGGGAVLREANVERLHQNGRIYFIDRPVDQLVPTADRPTASTREAIEKRYAERLPIYLKSADERIISVGDPEKVASDIIARHFGRK